MSVRRAHVFVRSGATWSEQDKFTASDGATDDIFGQSVSIGGDTAQASGATVSFTATAIDNVEVTSGPTCDHLSGSTFPVGITTVTCSVSDAAGTVGSASFTVTVVDTTPPAVTVSPDIADAEATGGSGAIISYSPATASDDVGVTSGPTCTPASGSTFPIGTTTITCSASDAAGNLRSASFTVTWTPPLLW